MKKKFESKVVVITGASSGIGFATAKYFAQNGYKVYGLARRTFKEENITSISCDVTDTEQIKKAIKIIIAKEKQIDILINNAGFGISGSAENQSAEDIKKQFDVNFFGAVNVTQQVLPIMRKQGFGKILNTSSVASVFPIPFQSYYCATKSSINVWAQALALEVKPYNIQICNVLVGDTKTGFTAVRQKTSAENEGDYADIATKSVAKMEKDEQSGKDPITVAKVFYKLANKKKIPNTKVVGGLYKFLLFLKRIVPEKFMMWVLSKLYG